MSEFQLFDSVVCNITFITNVCNSKSSEFDPRVGGRKFSKISEFQLFDSVVCNIIFIRNV